MILNNSTTDYTNIDTQKSVHFAVPRTETRLKNASDLYMKYRSYAEHCRPCTRLSGVSSLCTCCRDDAVTGDIPFDITPMESRWYPLVPSTLGLLGYTSSGCPTVCVLAHLGWACIGTGGGNGVASGLDAYNLQTNTYTL